MTSDGRELLTVQSQIIFQGRMDFLDHAPLGASPHETAPRAR